MDNKNWKTLAVIQIILAILPALVACFVLCYFVYDWTRYSYHFDWKQASLVFALCQLPISACVSGFTYFKKLKNYWISLNLTIGMYFGSIIGLIIGILHDRYSPNAVYPILLLLLLLTFLLAICISANKKEVYKSVEIVGERCKLWQTASGVTAIYYFITILNMLKVISIDNLFP